MALSKQAKILSKKQVDSLLWYVRTLRNGLRNQTIVLLSVRAGLRAKEIAGLKWAMITDAEGNISDSIHLTDEASKGRSGRIIPLNMKLRHQLEDLLEQEAQRHQFDVGTSYVISTERAGKTSAQAIVNMFSAWYVDMGLMGCSSHSEPPPVCRRLQSKYGWSLWKKVTEPTDFQLRYAPARFG